MISYCFKILKTEQKGLSTKKFTVISKHYISNDVPLHILKKANRPIY